MDNIKFTCKRVADNLNAEEEDHLGDFEYCLGLPTGVWEVTLENTEESSLFPYKSGTYRVWCDEASFCHLINRS